MRNGEKCKQCGACCKTLTFRVPLSLSKEMYKKTIHFYLTRGCTLKDGVLILPYPCPKLVDNKCSINPIKPEICAAFNGQGEEEGYYIPDTCVYK